MSVFRKVALERLSSPEQLDQLLQVTRPSGWLALGSLTALLAAALIWACAATVSIEAHGVGMLLRPGGVSVVVAAVGGQVEDVLVGVGDPIEKGQVVAKLRQDSLVRQIDKMRVRRQALVREYEDLERFGDAQRRLLSDTLALQRAKLDASIASLEREAALLEERIAAQRALVAGGLIGPQALIATEQELNQTRDRVAVQHLERSGLELKRREGEQVLEQRIDVRRKELRDLDWAIQDLSSAFEENGNVLSSGAGRVLELSVHKGDVVSPGTVILTSEVSSEELLAVLFVPASEGQQVRRGMAVKVFPSTGQREEHKYVPGTVRWVAEYPSTPRGMLRVLGNDELVRRLFEQGPMIEVDVALAADSTPPGGYRWSSSAGRGRQITSGTLADGRIVLDESRPISLLLSRVRSVAGS